MPEDFLFTPGKGLAFGSLSKGFSTRSLISPLHSRSTSRQALEPPTPRHELLLGVIKSYFTTAVLLTIRSQLPHNLTDFESLRIAVDGAGGSFHDSCLLIVRFSLQQQYLDER